MTTLEELTERINRIQQLLADPHPGLVTWQLALNKSVSELCKWWTADDPKPEEDRMRELLYQDLLRSVHEGLTALKEYADKRLTELQEFAPKAKGKRK